LLAVFAAVLVCWSAAVFACEPECPDCWSGDDCDVYDCDPNQECCGGSCITACTGCQSCDGSSCADDDDNCTGCKSCNEGTCEDDDSECNSSACQECNNGVCEDSWPPLGLYCIIGECVECRNILDCDLCQQCVNNECVHPCEDCQWPEYCGSACACVECYPGPEDTTTCSDPEFNFDDCTGCTIDVITPCSGAEDIVVYTGNTLTTCTGPDCEMRKDVLCYTTYDNCVPGIFKPFRWCISSDILGEPASCGFILDQPPPPGCYPCAPDPFEEGERTYETRGVCPLEVWP